MTDEQARELGERWADMVGIAGVTWRVGMLNMGGRRVIAYARDRGVKWAVGDNVWCWAEVEIPDFRDPATLGCLLAQVMEKWNAAEINLSNYKSCAYVEIKESNLGKVIEVEFRGDSLPCALIAALEAAP